MLKAKTPKIPIRETLLLSYKKSVTSIQKTKDMAKIRSIMYTIVDTHIDIVFTTLMVSYFTKNSGPNHFNIIDQILR